MSDDVSGNQLDPAVGRAMIRRELPGWTITRRGLDFMYVAKSPDYIPGQGGVVIEGRTPERVIAQARALLSHWSPQVTDVDADEHHTIGFKVDSKVVDAAIKRATPNPTALHVSDAVTEVQSPGRRPSMSPTGSICDNCQGSNMVRTGTCETCQDCGSTSGCA